MKQKVIIIVGPTAVGKTGVSILLAGELGSEIISADSMQIYRGMDIGTEKPTKDQLSLIPHHMIDIVEPSDEFSAGDHHIRNLLLRIATTTAMHDPKPASASR